MDFDPADLERAAEIVRTRLAEVPAHLARIQAAVAVAVDQPMLPDAIVTAILETTEQVTSEAIHVVATLEELLEGA
ncbi:MAG: hypothetical protein JOY78_00080, partial [Pseudonocardia sp.]|nr:hypothetical protein [Pseudonocardia sp.]